MYKMLLNRAAQETPPKEINRLTVDEITVYMKVQFDPTRFIVRERFKFRTDTKDGDEKLDSTFNRGSISSFGLSAYEKVGFGVTDVLSSEFEHGI